MNRLLEIGFQEAGRWCLIEGDLSSELVRHGAQKNVLYAFVTDGQVKYVGKTVQTLENRLYGYRKPGKGQTTNIRNHNLIRELLDAGSTVEILALPDNGLLHYGQFHLNLAAGLEDSIISVINPEWNGTRVKKPPNELALDRRSREERPTLVVVLHKTYFSSGFFNVPVSHEKWFGQDGELIDIFCGNAARPITGSINRRCNPNHTPRILGGTGLRDWLQANFVMLNELTVEIHSPNTIHIS